MNKLKFKKGEIVSATKAFNGEIITGEFQGYRLFNDEIPDAVVGVVHVSGDRNYDVDVTSIRHYESEDERIRKHIVKFIDEQYPTHGNLKEEKDKMLAYLEKQKEQRPELPLMGGDADTYFDDLRMTTKPLTSREWFNEGMKYAQRLQKEQKPNYCHYGGDPSVERCKYCSTACSARLTVEQKSVTNDRQQECPYKDLALVKNFFGEYKRKCKLSNKACDFKKCKQWDELQADFRNINEAFEDGEKEVIAHPERYGLYKPAEWSEEEKKFIKHCAELLDGQGEPMCALRLESLCPQKLDVSKLENYDPVEVLNKIKTEWPMAWEKVVGKQEWSEEDSDNLERVDDYLWMLDDYVGDDCAMPQGKTDKIRGNIQGILSPWLKSLPERFNLQPKQEWSEEDETKLRDVVRLVEDSGHVKSIREHYKKFLTSLPERFNLRSSWKPSEEQMEALRECGECKRCIKELYENLQKRYGTC